jgi:hypothetical protein
MDAGVSDHGHGLEGVHLAGGGRYHPLARKARRVDGSLHGGYVVEGHNHHRRQHDRPGRYGQLQRLGTMLGGRDVGAVEAIVLRRHKQDRADLGLLLAGHDRASGGALGGKHELPAVAL